MTTQNKNGNVNNFFKYNTIVLYKNNNPVNFDINKICEDLLKLSDNRESFDEMMKGIDQDVFTSELKRDIKSNTSDQNMCIENMYMNANLNTNPNDINMNVMNDQNRYNFRNTVPEGELMNQVPYQQKSLRKKYNDVNANSKYYYPNETRSSREINKSQWTNRANRILLNSQNNFNSISSVRMNNQSVQLGASIGGFNNNNMFNSINNMKNYSNMNINPSGFNTVNY